MKKSTKLIIVGVFVAVIITLTLVQLETGRVSETVSNKIMDSKFGMCGFTDEEWEVLRTEGITDEAIDEMVMNASSPRVVCDTLEEILYSSEGDEDIDGDINLDEEVTVYSLIQEDIKIGDNPEELAKVLPEQYKPEYDTYSFTLSNNLYGHISNGIISKLTVRMDNDPITLQEAEEVINLLLPPDSRFLNSKEEDPYIFYNYESASSPSSKIVVQVGVIGDNVKVIGFN